jgi:hypothetical protein
MDLLRRAMRKGRCTRGSAAMSQCAAAAPFGCAMLGEQDGPCWCTALPPVLPVPVAGTTASLAGARLPEARHRGAQSSRMQAPHD